jgi:transcriptional regulator with XRE-family HTH domain
MTKVEEKLKSISKPSPKGGWKEKVRFRNQNKAWLKKSSAIALKILAALDAPGWSQARLARELDVSPQMVSKLVKGHENFTLETLSKIEAVLGVELITILKEDEIVVKRSHFEALKVLQKIIINKEYKKEEVQKKSVTQYQNTYSVSTKVYNASNDFSMTVSKSMTSTKNQPYSMAS